MIFNTPQNRRKDHDNFKNNDITIKMTKCKPRKAKYPCGRDDCSKIVKTDAICCSNCDKWYHRNCITSMTKADLLFWAKHCSKSWTCDSCIEDILSIKLLTSDITDHGTTPTNTCSDYNKTVQNKPNSNVSNNTPNKSPVNMYPKIFLVNMRLNVLQILSF